MFMGWWWFSRAWRGRDPIPAAPPQNTRTPAASARMASSCCTALGGRPSTEESERWSLAS